MTSRKIERTRVVIVGAGIAGLAAAKTLEDAKFTDYLLIEAQCEIGGRILSLPLDHGWIEYGAQFLHGDSSKLAQYCFDNNLLSDVQGTDGQGIFLRNDGTTVSECLVREVNDFVRSVLEECEKYKNEDLRKTLEKNDSVGSILRSKFKEYLREKNDSQEMRTLKEEIFDWHVRFLMVDNSCKSLDDLSAMFWGKFEYAGGPEYLLFKSGYKSLTNSLCNNINQQRLRLNTPVKSILWSHFVSRKHSTITVLTHDDTKILTDAVIVTCSLGYLKENHRNMFDPPLPQRLNVAIETLGFELINKIFLDFGEQAWWQEGTKGFQVLWHKEIDKQFFRKWTRDLTGFDVLANYPAVLVGWVAGAGARSIENMPKKLIARDCVNLLARCLKRKIPPVKRCITSMWSKNKYVRGGHSHIARKCEAVNVTPATLAEPVWAAIWHDDENYEQHVPVILFAGEATHDRFYSTTHGAYETGINQAEVFLQHHASTM